MLQQLFQEKNSLLSLLLENYNNALNFIAVHSMYLHTPRDFVRACIVKPQRNQSEHPEVIFVMMLKALNVVVNSTEQKPFSIRQQTLLFLLINLTLLLQRAIISTKAKHQHHVIRDIRRRHKAQDQGTAIIKAVTAFNT